MYHGIDSVRDRGDLHLFVSPDLFDRQLDWLASRGYVPCSLAQFIDWFAHGGWLPPQSVLITFDDGYAGLHQHALPSLRRLDWPAAVFLVSALLGQHDRWNSRNAKSAGGRELLSRSQVLEMVSCGIDFHSHSRTHADLTTLDAPRLQDEVAGSRRELEDLLGRPVECFAYPYGRMSEEVQRAVKSAGYRFAFSVRSGFNRAGDEPLTIRRLDIAGCDTPARFGHKVSMGTNDASLGARLRYLGHRLASAGSVGVRS
jgi:peptidoglycan/xylan/chitin deacetylase (PgdA/CDA1 family)